MERKHNTKLVPYAKALRKNMTKEERHLWYDYLCNHPARFTRQKILGNYIADFYSAKAQLVIELDGSQHYERDSLIYDRIRSEYLEEYGLKVLRIPNNYLMTNFREACEYIDRVITNSPGFFADFCMPAATIPQPKIGSIEPIFDSSLYTREPLGAPAPAHKFKVAFDMNRVEKQYKTANNLNTRISIHDKYSTNKQPFGDWIVSHYELRPGDRILELGCRTGSMWKENLHLLKADTELILTDFSAGMLKTAKSNVICPQISFNQVDIQNIPYPENSFDVVIANMMLYHVPDLHRGLAEVRRVLKPSGTFYCATYGIHGIMEYITDLLKNTGVSGSIGTTFTLQNGIDSLALHFSQVIRLDREDGLAITNIEDFADYIYSMSSLTNAADIPRNVLLSLLENRMENDVLYVPKEYGMFICR